MKTYVFNSGICEPIKIEANDCVEARLKVINFFVEGGVDFSPRLGNFLFFDERQVDFF